MHALLHSVPPTLQQATTNPRLCWRLLDTHRKVWVSLFWGHCSFLLGPGAHKVLFEPSKHLLQVWGLILKSPLLPTCWGFSFALVRGVSSFGGIQHSFVNGCSAVSCSFGVLTREDKCTSFYSPLLWIRWVQTNYNYQMKSHTFFLCMNYVHFPLAAFPSSVLGSVGG